MKQEEPIRIRIVKKGDDVTTLEVGKRFEGMSSVMYQIAIATAALEITAKSLKGKKKK